MKKISWTTCVEKGFHLGLTRARSSVRAHTRRILAFFRSVISLIRPEYFFLIFFLVQNQVMISNIIEKGKGKKVSEVEKMIVKNAYFFLVT